MDFKNLNWKHVLMGSVDHEYITFNFGVAIVMEKLRVEVN